ncbi:MAG: Flp family type IVb pilin [Caulobacteraceae bacterium]
MHSLKDFFAEETGASAAEYALILAMVAMAIIGGAAALGTAIVNVFGEVGIAMWGAPPAPPDRIV